jgi:hypothetical protein
VDIQEQELETLVMLTPDLDLIQVIEIHQPEVDLIAHLQGLVEVVG